MDDGISNYSRLKNTKAPCPVCKLHINLSDSLCAHCNHKLTPDELTLVRKYAASQKLKGIKKGLLFFPIALFILFLIFSFVQYNEI